MYGRRFGPRVIVGTVFAGAALAVALGGPAAASRVEAPVPEVIATVPLDGLVGLAISPDGATLYAASASQSKVHVYDTATLTEKGSVRVDGTGRGSNPFELAISPDGAHLYVGNVTNPHLVVVDTVALSVSSAFAVSGIPRSIFANQDGTHVYVATTGATCTIDTLNEVTATVTSVPVYSPSSATSCDASWVTVVDTYLLVANLPANVVEVFNAPVPTGIKDGFPATAPTWMGELGGDLFGWTDGGAGGELTVAGAGTPETIPTGPAAHAVVSPDATIVYITNFQTKGEVAVVDIASKTVPHRIPVGNGPNDIAISPSGDRLYVANQGEGSISVIDLSGGGSGALATSPSATPSQSASPSAGGIAHTNAFDVLPVLVIGVLGLLVIVLVVLIVLLIPRKKRNAVVSPAAVMAPVVVVDTPVRALDAPETTAASPALDAAPALTSPATAVTEAITHVSATPPAARRPVGALIALFLIGALLLIALTVVVTLLLK